MGESIGICSGYFQCFHEGHKKYINECIKRFDYTFVIINNDYQQSIKYKNYNKIRRCIEIEYQIQKEFPNVFIIKSIDTDESVRETLRMINLHYKSKNNKLYFCKDADRNMDNIAEKEVLKELDMEFVQFNNPKENSSSKIMKANTIQKP